MRTIRSATTGHSGSRRKAKQIRVLATLAVLTAVAGALIQSRSEVSATASSRQVKTTVATQQAKLSDSAATPDGTAYTYSEANGTVTVSAAATTGGNNRELFWGSKGTTAADTEACATFSGNEDATYDQPGIALRMTNNGNQAVTVTENVWEGIRNVFNFHMWNTATPGVHTLFAQVTISAALPLPRRRGRSACAPGSRAPRCSSSCGRGR